MDRDVFAVEVLVKIQAYSVSDQMYRQVSRLMVRVFIDIVSQSSTRMDVAIFV